ncbi:S1 domain-containing RNA-binding protein [Aerococcaceae bacterium WGS1372]
MSVEVGQKITGKVTGITNFGAFVSLPDNQSGLVHISEVSDGFVKDINDILTVGDEVTVKVLKITPDGKINLSIRKAQEQSKTQESNQNRGKDEGSFRKPNENRSQSPNRTNASPSHKTSQPPKTSGGNDFDALMSQFLKDSEDRLTSLRRNTEGKRGGRGGRRN